MLLVQNDDVTSSGGGKQAGFTQPSPAKWRSEKDAPILSDEMPPWTPSHTTTKDTRPKPPTYHTYISFALPAFFLSDRETERQRELGGPPRAPRRRERAATNRQSLTAYLHGSGELQETRLVEEDVSCHQTERSDVILGQVDLRAWPLTFSVAAEKWREDREELDAVRFEDN